VRAIADRAHAVGALAYVDGVHATPHVPTDVRALGADFYVFSSYKLFGPHAGAVVADPALLESLAPAKLAPAADEVPDRFERGTPAFELLAGITAAVDWLAALTDAAGSRRERLVASLSAVEEYLAGLLRHALDGLAAIDGVRVLPAPPRRTSTLSFVVEGHTPLAVAEHLAQRRVSVWNGDNYAYELMNRFGLQDSGGAVRASLVLYNAAGDLAAGPRARARHGLRDDHHAVADRPRARRVGRVVDRLPVDDEARRPAAVEVTLHWISCRKARGPVSGLACPVDAWAGPAYAASALATRAVRPKTRARLIAESQ
jgi:hypothetical protein